jgi:hypothetical protein
MSSGLFIAGAIYSLVGILLMTPLSDYLPINFWLTVRQLLSESSDGQFYKIVPAPRHIVWAPAVWMTAGAALVWTGLWVRGT